jgi:hypothetical protein
MILSRKNNTTNPPSIPTPLPAHASNTLRLIARKTARAKEIVTRLHAVELQNYPAKGARIPHSEGWDFLQI